MFVMKQIHYKELKYIIYICLLCFYNQILLRQGNELLSFQLSEENNIPKEIVYKCYSEITKEKIENNQESINSYYYIYNRI